ncbi:MAG: hypothetical protein ACKPKO_29770, partial [Candidatus Fonsibacter sp.]
MSSILAAYVLHAPAGELSSSVAASAAVLSPHDEILPQQQLMAIKESIVAKGISETVPDDPS